MLHGYSQNTVCVGWTLFLKKRLDSPASSSVSFIQRCAAQATLNHQAGVNVYSFSGCRSASSELMQPSGRPTCRQSSKRRGGASALTSTTSSSARRPWNASCHQSWASTRPWTKRWRPARGRCRPTCMRTERVTPTWVCPSARCQEPWAETAASTWTGWAQTTPIEGRSPSSKTWNENNLIQSAATAERDSLCGFLP